MNKYLIKEEMDINKIYDYNLYPDRISGRCDNCNKAHFTSSISKGKLLRECRNCSMKKII
ncbi:hypothetical protein ACTNDN_06820 [Niallia sp. HCP3S3_B10]|uniref:hypothetical protein n=1 Tax=Niallia sp. HCP3S3_B10 TaxID=3438944 RepID=UPI003F8CD2C6